MLLRAIADNLVASLRDGTPMPSGAWITCDPHALDGVARDEHGNAIGGLRAPWVEVPTAQYLPRCSCSPTTGEKIPFSDDEIARLYGDADTLRAACRAASTTSSNAGSSCPSTPRPCTRRTRSS